ncbi:putative DnaJ subfamily B member 4, partial [Monoraphidium neglectum]
HTGQLSKAPFAPGNQAAVPASWLVAPRGFCPSSGWLIRKVDITAAGGGTKITFPGKGDERPGLPPADLQFVVEEAPHPRFMRQGDDLHTTVRVPLVSALCGGDASASVETLDGRTLKFPLPAMTSFTVKKIIQGEGMPISKQPGKKGNLVVSIEAAFPKGLTAAQKAALKQALPATA